MNNKNSNTNSIVDQKTQGELRRAALGCDYMDSIFRKPELESWPMVTEQAAKQAKKDFLAACEEQAAPAKERGVDLRFEQVDAQELADRIKKEVIGQDEAVERIAEYFMLSRVRQEKLADGTASSTLPSVNACLLIGPTAAGKGHTLKVSARALSEGNEVKVFTIKCNTLTGEGWRGRTLDSELNRVSTFLKGNPGAQAIVFFDEIDKKALTEGDFSAGGFNPQPDIMAFVECEDTYDGQSDEKSQGRFTIDMSRVFIVLAGAFTGIGSEVVARRLKKSEEGSAMLHASRDSAWHMDEYELRQHIIPQDLAEYGMMPELLGRIASIVNMPALAEDSLAAIVNQCENSLESKLSKLLPEGTSFVVEDEAARFIAHRAYDSQLGARALEPQLYEVAAQALDACRNREEVCTARIFVEREQLALQCTSQAGR